MTHRSGRRGIIFGDALLVLSALTLALALAWPWIIRREINRQIALAIADVEVAADAVGRFQADRSAWPEPVDSGVTPPDLGPYLPDSFAFQRTAYRLHLHVWERLEEPPQLPTPDLPLDPLDPANAQRAEVPMPTERPPAELVKSTLGLSVHSTDLGLLASLLDHFGSSRSFVHAGSWTLVLTADPAG